MHLPGHGRFDFSPITQRPDYNWPEGKRLALYLALNIESFAFGTGLGHTFGVQLPAPDQRETGEATPEQYQRRWLGDLRQEGVI